MGCSAHAATDRNEINKNSVSFLGPALASAPGGRNTLSMIREFRQHSNRRQKSVSGSWRAIGLFTALAFLSACTPPQTRKAPQPHGQEAALIPATQHLTLSDGAIAPLRLWPAKGQTKAILLALHGFGESRDAWEFSAPQLAASGITTVAPDQRGFGETKSRGQWSSTARLVKDAREEALWIHKEHPNVPLYVMGESMGGAVTALLASNPPKFPINGVILVSPAVWRFDPLSRLVLEGLDILAPDWVFTGAHVPGEHVATNNIAALRRLYFDPLTLHGFRLDTLRGLVTLMAEGQKSAPKINLPLLVLYGDRDQMIPPEPMARFWQKLPISARKDLIPGGHHLLLRDLGGRNAIADIASWILTPDKLLPSGGDAAAAAWVAGDSGHPAL